MDARARLRAYLEQRRELGESEFVLDGVSVEEAMKMLDSLRKARPAESAPSAPVTPAAPVIPAKAGIHGRAGPEPSASQPALPEAGPRPPMDSRVRGNDDVDESADVPAAPDVRVPAATSPAGGEMKGFTQGLVVGTPNGSLFEDNPFSGVRSLTAIAKLVQECTRCDLYKTATHGVPGEGAAHADFMVVGEAPGATEDETGRPFVGQSGELLTKILAAIDLKREDVFIANVVKHRPPGNRDPKPDEVRACSPYLIRQIQLIKPKVILALGTFAAQTLLDTKTPIGKLRGAVHRYYGIPLVVTYHPAALLRNPAWKRPTWEDVKLARRVLDSEKS
jgi:DNA polymerase